MKLTSRLSHWEPGYGGRDEDVGRPRAPRGGPWDVESSNGKGVFLSGGNQLDR